MSDKHHNMTAGGDQHVEPKAYALSEQYEIPGHNLDTENSIIQEMCRGNKLYKVQEKQVPQDELKKLDDGKMVAVSAPVTNLRSQNIGGCASSVVSILFLCKIVTILCPDRDDQSDRYPLLVHIPLP